MDIISIISIIFQNLRYRESKPNLNPLISTIINLLYILYHINIINLTRDIIPRI